MTKILQTLHDLWSRALFMTKQFYTRWPKSFQYVILATAVLMASGGTLTFVGLYVHQAPSGTPTHNTSTITTHTPSVSKTTPAAPKTSTPTTQTPKGSPAANTPSPTPTTTTKAIGASGGGSGSTTTTSGGTSTGSSGSSTSTSPSTLYVQPGTQGYRGSLSTLATYSAANGQVPPGTSCAWNQTYKYLRCSDTDLTLDHVYIEGGLYWTGCGSLTLTNSIFDWYPSQTWSDVYQACTAPNTGATITASYSTFETSPSVIHYTGGSDIGGISEYTGDTPMNISHSLVQGFSQGFDPGGGSVISSSEIYVQDNTCSGGVICHGDGLFSQGGDNITYEYNYIVSPSDATSAIFYQSSPNSNGNSVIGNYLKGGSYALYNENSNSLTVENNTFGGATYGDCDLYAGASWGTWSGNVTSSGAAVVPSGNGCT